MKLLQRTHEQNKALKIATAIAVVVGALFLKDYFILFTLSVILSFMFSPLYRKLNKKLSSGSSAAITLIVSFFAIIIPVIAVLTLATLQVKNLSTNVSSTITSADFGKIGDHAIKTINTSLNSIPFVNVTVTEQSIIESVKNLVQSFGNTLLDIASSFASSFVGFITSSIIFIYIFLSVLMHGDKLLSLGKKLNPLGDEASELYISRTRDMIKGTVKGQFIIALVQGLLGAITFVLVGYGQFFFVLLLVFTLLSVIPLGAGIVSIPLGVIMIFFGNISGGIIVILQHIIINTNIDNILRPILVPKNARLDPALMLVSVFAGIRMFGFLGIVIGPTLMILLVTTVKMYLDSQKTSNVSE